MAKTSKPFRVAAEGQTVDGREITRQQIQEMADSYDQNRYGARIWNNHFRGITPDSIFAPMGDVLKLTAMEFDAEGGTKKLGLYAVISALDNLLNMISTGTNIYWSIEMAPNFAGGGKTYCVGLAPTDDPASLWTEPAKFTATGALEATRHLYANTLFSALVQAKPEWEDPAPNQPNLGAELLAKVKGMFTGAAMNQHDIAKAVETLAGEVAERFKSLVHVDAFGALKSRVDALEAGRTADRQEFTALKENLSKTPDGSPNRPPAPGGNGAVLTDC